MADGATQRAQDTEQAWRREKAEFLAEREAWRRELAEGRERGAQSGSNSYDDYNAKDSLACRSTARFACAVTAATLCSLAVLAATLSLAFYRHGGDAAVHRLLHPPMLQCECDCGSAGPKTAESVFATHVSDISSWASFSGERESAAAQTVDKAEVKAEKDAKVAAHHKLPRQPRREVYTNGDFDSSDFPKVQKTTSATEKIHKHNNKATERADRKKKKTANKKKKKKKKKKKRPTKSTAPPLTPEQIEIVSQLNLRGIDHVNEGTATALDAAVVAFTRALELDGANYVAMVGRGSAHSIRGDIPAALDDFSSALDINADHAEAWKRRGQTHAVGGDANAAIADLTQALKLPGADEDTAAQLGILYHKQRNFVEALKILKRSVREHGERSIPVAASLRNIMGQCYVSIGESEKAITQYQRALRTDSTFLEAHVNVAQAALQLADLDRTLSSARSALDVDSNLRQAWHMSLLVHFGAGNMRASAAACDQCLGLTAATPRVTAEAMAWAKADLTRSSKLVNHLRRHYDETCLWQRAMASMAMGQLHEAIAQFDTLLLLEKEDGGGEGGDEISDIDDDFDDDESGAHHLVFYQREWAVYQLRNLDRDVRTFNPDREIHPYFKEFFTMRESPRVLVHELDYSLQVLPRTLKLHDVILETNMEDMHSPVQRGILAAQQKYFPTVLQLQSLGFLSNPRQHRQAGLAILTIAQQLRKHWHSVRNTTLSASSSKGAYLEVHGGGGSNSANPTDHAFGWRDAFDVAVKWRQLVSANDSVWWIDQLGRWDDDELNNEGFGLRTPMVSGQLKVVRYYPYFQKAFESMRALILSQYDDLTPRQRESVPHATSLDELYTLLDSRDFWVTSLCESEASPGRIMEGTRLTVERLDESHGFEFTIRTPGTKPRWEQYREELDYQFTRLAEIMTATTEDRPRNSTEIATIAAKIFFYWVNFAPLSRGSAATGYVGLHAVLLAAGYKIREPIPVGVQADWEAILTPDPDIFVEELRGWLIDAVEPCSPEGGSSTEDDWLSEIGDVGAAFKTYRDMYTALNVGDDRSEIFPEL